MKAFLMYKDRDFDLDQLLIRRDKESPRSKAGLDQSLDLQSVLPWNAEALTQDLGLNVLLDAMSNGDRFLCEVAKVALLSGLTDPQTIRYRQHALDDGLKNAQLIMDMYQIAVDAIAAEKKGYWSYFSRYPRGILHRSVEVLQTFVGMLKRLRHLAEQHCGKFESEAFSKLFATIKQELSDEYFLEIEQHLQRLKFRSGVLVSAQLGKGNKGANYVLRTPRHDARSWLVRLLAEKPPSYTFHLHPRDEAGAQALSELADRGVNLVANALAQSADHILGFFQMLRTELAFYVGGLNLYGHLIAMGEPICFPDPVPAGRRKLSFSALHDVSLALSAGGKVVENDLNADHRGLVIITGANTGGKSTFLRSVGIGQLMMQAGMFVAAESFSSEVCEGLYTHFKREEDKAMESGKLDEELSRISGIIDRTNINSMLLFNESFASTHETEGSQIAEQITIALVDKGIKVLFVTHLYTFAHRLCGQGRRDTLFLRAERLADGTRTFRMIKGEPLQTSYGADLYESVFGAERPAETTRGSQLQRPLRAAP
jgi:hypothetical protein